MARAIAVPAPTTRWWNWLGYLVAGVSLGLAVTLGSGFGVWESCAELLGAGVGWLNETVGPVWIPMLVIAFRVGVLTSRAASTRSGCYSAHGSGTQELEHLAPLFTGLGFAGSVWGMWAGFGSLEGGHLLDQLPTLLQGIGAAMVSTLVGLGCWAATLSLATWVPWWTWARVTWKAGDFHVALDDRELGTGSAGLEQLVESIRGRQPEALCLAFDSRVPVETKHRIATAVWAQRDADLAYREATLR